MLQVITRTQAAACVREQVKTIVPRTETVDLLHVAGRVLAEDVTASLDVPGFDRTTVDGYAVLAADTFGAGAAVPAELTVAGDVRMGEAPSFRLRSGQCARIATGGMLPSGADAAVMVEHTEEDAGVCLIFQGVAPGENITKRGDDVKAGSTVLNKGTTIGPSQIGVLAALGIQSVPVFQKPRIAVLSTGDELAKGDAKPGQVQDINSFLLSAAAEACGCTAVPLGAVPDDRDAICRALERGLENADMVLISGGSSAGTRDMTVDILRQYGDVLFHGVAMKPGKPTIFGMAAGKPVFGLPGHPLAAYFVFRLLVREAIGELLSLPPDKPFVVRPLAVNVPSNHGREEFLCVKTDENGRLVPMHTKSGIISVLAGADGFIRIPRDTEGLQKGEETELYLL